jgi:hypothetical protein
MMLDTDRVADRTYVSDPTLLQSGRAFSVTLACGSGAIATLPPLFVGASGIICATLALVVFAAVVLASFLI